MRQGVMPPGARSGLLGIMALGCVEVPDTTSIYFSESPGWIANEETGLFQSL